MCMCMFVCVPVVLVAAPACLRSEVDDWINSLDYCSGK